MIELETLATYDPLAGGGIYQVFSPWIPRGGDNARFTFEVAAISNAKLTVYVYHKNAEETGNGAVAAITNFSFVNTTGIDTKEWLGLKELVRFLLIVECDDEQSEVGWVSFRFLNCVWFEGLKA